MTVDRDRERNDKERNIEFHRQLNNLTSLLSKLVDARLVGASPFTIVLSLRI